MFCLVTNKPFSGGILIRISVNCILNSCHDLILFSIPSCKARNVACCRNVSWIFHVGPDDRNILAFATYLSSFHIYSLFPSFVIIFLVSYVTQCLSLAQILSYSLSHTQLSPLSLFINPFFSVPSAVVGETCFGGERYPDTFWMCLWTRRGQSQWCMAVIPILQRDTAVSCHGRQDDLYSAALLMAWYKWC